MSNPESSGGIVADLALKVLTLLGAPIYIYAAVLALLAFAEGTIWKKF